MRLFNVVHYKVHNAGNSCTSSRQQAVASASLQRTPTQAQQPHRNCLTPQLQPLPCHFSPAPDGSIPSQKKVTRAARRNCHHPLSPSPYGGTSKPKISTGGCHVNQLTCARQTLAALQLQHSAAHILYRNPTESSLHCRSPEAHPLHTACCGGLPVPELSAVCSPQTARAAATLPVQTKITVQSKL